MCEGLQNDIGIVVGFDIVQSNEPSSILSPVQVEREFRGAVELSHLVRGKGRMEYILKSMSMIVVS